LQDGVVVNGRIPILAGLPVTAVNFQHKGWGIAIDIKNDAAGARLVSHEKTQTMCCWLSV
jgi:hypothetical protein